MLRSEKAALRRTMSRELRRLEATDRSRRSLQIAERVSSHASWPSAAVVLGFYPLDGEVDVLPLLAQAIARGKLVFLPRIDGDDLEFHAVSDLESGLELHPYGMREPRPELPRLEVAGLRGTAVVITPGLAFDRFGRRLGRGKGYYDRFLRRMRRLSPSPVVALAVAFSEQIVGAVPCGAEDERVDAVMTDREVLLPPRA